MTHPNDATAWAAICCQRGCEAHRARDVHVDLRQRHGYPDLPQVPESLAVRFDMRVWDEPVDGGPYCPAHDAVSETILSHHIWEPCETILTLSVIRRGLEVGVVVDMGAQIGWFSLLALAAGAPFVEAWEADPDNVEMLLANAELNGWGNRLSVVSERIGPETPPGPATPRIRLAKVDVEGAEPEAIDVLWPAIEAGNLDFLLVECSPVFHFGYHGLIERLRSAGYAAYHVPPKPCREPLATAADLEPLQFRSTAELDGHQEDVWFAREGLAW